jgi:NADPH2:quinone reductase
MVYKCGRQILTGVDPSHEGADLRRRGLHRSLARGGSAAIARAADHLIDYGTQNLRERIHECTDRGGVDVVFDPVGGAYSEPALRSLRFGGRLLVVGFAAGEIPKLPLNLALLGERGILGVLWGEWTRRDPGGYSRNQRVLGEWYRAGRLTPAITERVDLAGAIGALKRMVDRQVSGKIIVLPEL